MKNKFTFIFGGIRSGKSDYALELAKKSKKQTVFVATANGCDSEMKERIKKHQKSRPKNWKTVEEGIEIDTVFFGLDKKYELVVIDCLGIFISNLLSKGFSEQRIKNKVKKLIKAINKVDREVIAVSNEVGMSLVALNPLGRKFQDLAGFTNRVMAKAADKVIFMRAGIAQILKGEKSNG